MTRSQYFWYYIYISGIIVEIYLNCMMYKSVQRCDRGNLRQNYYLLCSIKKKIIRHEISTHIQHLPRSIITHNYHTAISPCGALLKKNYERIWESDRSCLSYKVGQIIRKINVLCDRVTECYVRGWGLVGYELFN